MISDDGLNMIDIKSFIYSLKLCMVKTPHPIESRLDVYC